MQGECVMSDNSINPISTVQLAAVSGALPKPQVKMQQATPPAKAPAADSSNQDGSQKQMENESEHSSAISFSNVSVHFRINDDTNELTVFVVDRENKKVLRTIPASEFSKLNAGDILQLTA